MHGRPAWTDQGQPPGAPRRPGTPGGWSGQAPPGSHCRDSDIPRIAVPLRVLRAPRGKKCGVRCRGNAGFHHGEHGGRGEVAFSSVLSAMAMPSTAGSAHSKNLGVLSVLCGPTARGPRYALPHVTRRQSPGQMDRQPRDATGLGPGRLRVAALRRARCSPGSNGASPRPRVRGRATDRARPGPATRFRGIRARCR